MPNFTISEILTIMLVILVVFGPQRLPEMAQKAGQLVRKARTLVNDLKGEFEGEWQEVAQPLKDVREEIQGVKRDMESSIAELNDDVAKAKQELEAEMAEAKKGMEDEVAEVNRQLEETVRRTGRWRRGGGSSDDYTHAAHEPSRRASFASDQVCGGSGARLGHRHHLLPENSRGAR